MREFLDRVAKLPPKRLALLAWELQQKVEALERSRREPIAVIGLGCRFPGGAESPRSFWQLLTEGRDAIVEVPRSRWDIDAYYDADPDAPGKMSTRFGGFLDQVDLFDPLFFGVAPREAQSLDPQQRLLLEVTWEALEHAGQSPDRLHGTRTGVFVGVSGHDYYVELITASDSSAYDAYLATGSAHSVASGRLSYVLGLHGPSLAVDTACSSSLVAVHLACQSLRAGDCRMALAGGVNAILSPDVTVTLSRARMMAPDGRCKAFDARADGFVRGEGCGVVVLKRLSDAQADGDRILAVIRGTAVNQDGKSSGLTAPNGPAQEDVIRLALADAGVDAARVSYLETHGTGTSLGDPIEVRALGAVLAANRPKDRPLLLGSVKTNIGHLESAAGVAGLIKLVLCLQHDEIPPNLHFRTPSPHIPWDEFSVRVVSERTRWSPETSPRIGGLSSFGFSGTNAHLVVEEAPAPAPLAPGAVERPAHVLTLSAKTPAALQALAARYAAHLPAHPEQAWPDVCHTANAGRAHLPQRLALVAASAEAAQARLAAVATAAGNPEGVVMGRAPASGTPPLAFLFTGQGAQYVGMGRELYETQPTFRQTLDRCAEALRPHLEHPLLAVMWGEAGPAGLLDQTGYTQPALFALEVALATLWQSWGVTPTWVLGHSVGEVAAAVVAGALTLEDGGTLIATRARLMQALPPDGAMVAVAAPAAQVQAALAPYAAEVSLAAVNGPASVVLSGRRAAVAQVVQTLTATGVRTTPLAVSHAFHSPLMEPMLADFERVAAGLTYTPPRLGLLSNLTGQPLRPGDLDAAYWRRHVRAPVQFQAGILALQAQGVTCFLEVGPHPVLCGLGPQCLPAGTGTWLPTLRKGRPAWDTVLATLAALYVRGVEVDWAAFDRPYPRRKVSLPTYPFQRERYWVAGGSRRLKASSASVPDPTDGWLYETVWKTAPSLQGASLPRLVGVPPLREVAERVEERLPSVAAEHRLETYDALLPELDALCGLYVRKGFRDLGFAAGRGECVSAETLRVRLGILETHRRLLDRLLVILEEEGVLRKHAGDWEMFRSLEGEDPDHLFHLLLERFPAHQAELTVAARCGERLAEVLQGRADPLQILFPGGSVDLAEKLYQEAPAARVFNTLVREAMAAVLGAVPADRSIRVIEIGAGTGATTAHVLSVLPEGRTEYVFTDVSRLFLGKAEEKFHDRPSLRYKLLDIERDPVEQGFAPHSFDVVIASNVLHATADLRRTLANVRRLLAPEGLLVLLEATGPHRFEDLTVGLTEGWWRFSDLDLRPSYALLDQKRWVELLREEGFTDAVAVPAGSDLRGALAHQAVVLARGPQPAAGGRWLIVADAGGLGAKVADDLRQRGGNCVVLPAGTVSTSDDVRGVLEADGDSWRAVVHLQGLDAPPPSALSVPALAEAERDICGSALALTQAVARSATRPRLWIVTRGAQPAGSQRHPLGLPQAPLWGLGKVIALEHPELRCTRVDLDPSAGASSSELLVSELLSSGPEDQVAFREDERLVARLARKVPPSSATPALSADATYLITGGLAGLGLLVARWLVERGARHLVLMGRRAPAEAARTAIREMEAHGAQVVVAQGDVAREADVQGVLAQIAGGQPPLRGIIHAAGVLDDGVLLQQTWERFAKVLAPKVEGAWNLHRLTQTAPLDFFVLFSSAAALLGSPGQANHAAANAFLDALAHHRRALGLPAVSINWGVWGEVGAAADRGVEGRVGGHGMDAFTPANGLHVLGRLLGDPSAQVGVFPVDWARLAGHLPQGLPFYADLGGAACAVRGVKRDPETFQGVLEQAPAARRWSLLEDRVRAETVKVLGLDPSRFVGTDRPLQELGLDSLMAVELRNALGKVVGETLPATLLFDHPTIERLVAHLGRHVLALEPAESPKTWQAPAPVGQAREADIEGLSEDQMATLLAQRLDAIDRGRDQ